MSVAPKAAFLLEAVTLPLEKILPSRTLKEGVKSSSRYKTIESSVREVRIIEPLVVCPQPGKSGLHLLLDGHVRLDVLRALGKTETLCLVSTDDEHCTYNHRVNRISPVQENRMIEKALDAGVPEARIAKALNLKLETVRRNKSRLVGISPQAIEHLKDKPVTEMALRFMKKVKPYRQVEMAELMKLSNTFTASYARALYMSTPREQLVDSDRPDSRPEQLAQLDSEMRGLERDFVLLDGTYSKDTLNLQLVRSYLKKVLANARVEKYLTRKHAELLAQLQRVVEVSSLES